MATAKEEAAEASMKKIFQHGRREGIALVWARNGPNATSAKGLLHGVGRPIKGTILGEIGYVTLEASPVSLPSGLSFRSGNQPIADKGLAREPFFLNRLNK